MNLGRNGEMRGETGSSSQANDGSNMTVEPEALTNILNILRENHGSKEAVAEDTTQPGDETMDES